MKDQLVQQEKKFQEKLKEIDNKHKGEIKFWMQKNSAFENLEQEHQQKNGEQRQPQTAVTKVLVAHHREVHVFPTP